VPVGGSQYRVQTPRLVSLGICGDPQDSAPAEHHLEGGVLPFRDRSAQKVGLWPKACYQLGGIDFNCGSDSDNRVQGG